VLSGRLWCVAPDGHRDGSARVRAGADRAADGGFGSVGANDHTRRESIVDDNPVRSHVDRPDPVPDDVGPTTADLLEHSIVQNQAGNDERRSA